MLRIRIRFFSGQIQDPEQHFFLGGGHLFLNYLFLKLAKKNLLFWKGGMLSFIFNSLCKKFIILFYKRNRSENNKGKGGIF